MPLRRVMEKYAPGLASGAAESDPSSIATYAQAAAVFGLSSIWLMVIAFPLLAAVQEASTRLSVATGKGLVQNFATRIPRPLLWCAVGLFVFINAFNLGADLGVMALSAQFVWAWPRWVYLLFFGTLVLLLQVAFDFKRVAEVLKWICILVFGYVIIAFALHAGRPDVVLSTCVQEIKLTNEYLLILVALLGATISPYLFIWQSSQLAENGLRKPAGSKHNGAAKKSPSVLWLAASNLLAAVTIFSAARVLCTQGFHDVKSLAEAVQVLTPIAGPYTTWLFALGVIATGLLAGPVLTGSAAYAVAEAANFPHIGISKTWKQAPRFFTVIVLVALLGLASSFFSTNPVRTLIYAQVGNASLAPFLILGILLMTDDKKLLGKNTNGFLSRVLLWTAIVVMVAALVFWIVA
jgi:Mn2+/Fe2+ NRAMP family transporter